MKQIVHRMHWWFFVGKLVPWLFGGAAVLILLALSGLVPAEISVPHDLYSRVRIYSMSAIPVGAVTSLMIAAVQWSCTSLTIDRGIAVYRKGVLSRTVARVPVEEIASVDLRQSLLQRLLNTGNLVIDMRGASLLRLNMLNDPAKIQEEILAMRKVG